MRDALGARMKEQYEFRTRYLLPRRTYTIIRCDGKAFHTFTRHFSKPWDASIIEAMDAAAVALCEQAQSASFAYVQSDEISVLLTDFARPETAAWFDGNVQKIVSVAASVVTAEFNRSLLANYMVDKYSKMAHFDARVFTIPDYVEVANYFIWRQQDAIRNSIQSLAHSKFSHAELEGKSGAEMQEMLFQEHGINWAKEDLGNKNGRYVRNSPDGWTAFGASKFTTELLAEEIPRHWEEKSDGSD